MAKDDAALMEESLVAVADSGVEIRDTVFDRFFAAFPDHREAFLSVETTARQMTEETLEMLYGLAQGESWVWPRIADLVYEHQAYGDPGLREYGGFVRLLIEELGNAAGDGWTAACEGAWIRQAEKLEEMIGEAIDQWAEAMPQGGIIGGAASGDG